MNKKIYIVRGSEDGVIGAYSNKKKAFESSLRYVGVNGAELDVLRKGECVSIPASYSSYVKEYIPDVRNNGLVAQTEMFYLNQH